ncbi:MAG TPA: hypothetical protein VF128_12175 [Gemmatimonadaceae bacterium]
MVLFTCHERRLRVLVESSPSQRASLPWGSLSRSEALDAAATRIARRSAGAIPDWMEQLGAFTEGTTHPSGASLSVGYVGVRPWIDRFWWQDATSLSNLAERQRHMVTTGLVAIRARLEQEPIAFAMLPREFTLSELQATYETILARRLHKASFRRALQAAFLVEPTGEQRGEGRGRPAQLFRFAPRRRKSARRGVRLDLL